MSTSARTLTGPDDIAAAVAAIAPLAPTPAVINARRTLARRARTLSLTHLIPPQWLRPPRHPAALVTASATDDNDPLAVLAARTNIPANAIRTAFMRGVRDYAMTSPHLRPPPQLTREIIAQARAAALARRANGDPAARADDDDLLSSFSEGDPR